MYAGEKYARSVAGQSIARRMKRGATLLQHLRRLPAQVVLRVLQLALEGVGTADCEPVSINLAARDHARLDRWISVPVGLALRSVCSRKVGAESPRITVFSLIERKKHNNGSEYESIRDKEAS